MGILGDQLLLSKISVVIKRFLIGKLHVSHYSGTAWIDDSESPFLEVEKIQDKGENDSMSCDQE